MDDQSFLEYFFGLLNFCASKRKNTSLPAAEYHALTTAEKMGFFNETVIPDWKEAGAPREYTAQLDDFTRFYFTRARTDREIDGL